MAVGADGNGPAVAHVVHRRKDTVPEIGFGRGAQPRDGAGAGERRSFGRRHVSGVDRRPAAGEIEFPHQHFDGAEATECEAILHLLHLLGNMDVDRGLGRQGCNDFTKQVWRDGPERMGGDAGTRQRSLLYRQAVHDLQESFRIIDEAALSCDRRLTPETAEGIERRQDGDGNARSFGRRQAAETHLSGIGIGRAIRLVVEVLKLAHD